ncbi:unnamed protein product [Psylliodes chrysocephalus]|uniref:Uncharacterized protein n=1 Tax=Psylliodes chrysocephalus TaxID=3402493 RepID=A0A9P0CKY8_9CUCU|nr:unnamed protein product [Psylliodes chrysocephala]
MAIRASGKKKCLDCENYKRKLKENDHTVSARDVLIEMLQTELKKKEGLYRNAIDEHEKLRFMHCSVVQDYTNLKEIHKKLTEENRKLCEENQNLLAKIRETENLPESSIKFNDQTCEPFDKKDISNIRNVADGITNIQNIMQCQNKSLRSMLVQLLDELKKSRLEHSPERVNQNVENKDNSNETNESLKKEIEDLNTYIEKLQKENKKIKENLYEKQVSLKNCLTVLENNNSDIDNLSKHVEGLCRQRDKYGDQVTALENELLSKENEISKLKSETEQIENVNSKLNHDICSLKSQIDTYSSEYKKLKSEINNTVEDKTELENKVNEYQTQFEQIQNELQDKLKEFEDYKEDMLVTIDQLKNDLEEARVEQDSKGIQCTFNRPVTCNTSTQESPIMKNRTAQSFEDCLSVCYKNTQVDDLEITGCCKKPLDKEMIELEVHKQELQTLENEFLQYRCVMDYRIQSLEKDNNELKENISIISSDHEKNLKKIDEEYHKCKHDLDTKIRTLEEDKSILRNSLEQETSLIKFELEKVKTENNIYVCHCKNKINEIELENSGLRDKLSNMANENRDNLTKLEENYCICKHALEARIKQLDEENKHLRDTLDIVTTDDNKSIEDDFNTLKTILENKIRLLEKENSYLKELINSTTKDYEDKLTEKESEMKELLKKTDQNQTTIKTLIDEQNQYLQSIIYQVPNSNQTATDMGENCDLKTVLQLKIKHLIDNQLKLEQNLATVSSENVSYLNTIEELSKPMKNQKYTVLTCLLDQVDKINQTDEIKGIENETNELKEELNEMQRKVLTLEMELENANLELTEYEEENRSYSQRLQILMNEISSLQETKLHADADINDYNLKLIQVQEEFTVLSRDRNQTITELNYKITELESKLVDFDCNVSKLKESKKENERLQNKLDDTEMMLNNIRNELDSLHLENNKLKSLEMLVQQKDEQLMEYCNQLNVVQEQLKDNECKCQEYESKIKEYESNKRVLEEKISEYEKLIKETSKETDRLRKLISDLEEEQNNIKNNNVEKTDENNKELFKQIITLQEQLKKKKTIIKSLEQCIDKSNIVLQHCEKEMRIVQKNNESLKKELENTTKEEISFLKEKSEQLFQENQRLKEQLQKSPNRFNNKENLKLKIEYQRLMKESQAKDKDLKNLKQQLMQLAAQTKKPITAQKAVSFATNTKLFDPKTIQTKPGCSKSNDSDPNTPKIKKDVRQDLKKKLTPTSPQVRTANQKISDSTRSPHSVTGRVATTSLKSESLPNTLRKGALIKNKPKDVSVYLALSNAYPSEKGTGRIQKTQAVPGDEETVSRVYGGASDVPKNDPPNKRKPDKKSKMTALQFAGASISKDDPTESVRPGPRFSRIGADIPGGQIQSGSKKPAAPMENLNSPNTSTHSKESDEYEEFRKYTIKKLLSTRAHSQIFDDEIDPRLVIAISDQMVKPNPSDDQTEETEQIEDIEEIEETEQIEETEEYEQSKLSLDTLVLDEEGPIDRRSSEMSKDLDLNRGSAVSKHKMDSSKTILERLLESNDERRKSLNQRNRILTQPYERKTSRATSPRVSSEYIHERTNDDGRNRLNTRGRHMNGVTHRTTVNIQEEMPDSDLRKSILSTRPRRSVADHRLSRIGSDSTASRISETDYTYDGSVYTGTFYIDNAGSEQRQQNRKISLKVPIDEEEPSDRSYFKSIHQNPHDERSSDFADFSSYVAAPRARVSIASRNMMISAGTDPIKPLRLSRGTSPEQQENITEQKQQTNWNRRIYAPIEKREEYIDLRGRITVDTGSDAMQKTKQKSVQINKTSCNCMSVIMQQYKTQDGRIQNAYSDIVQLNQDCPCPKVSRTGCSFSFGSYWEQPDFDGDYSDESNSDSSSLCEEVNIGYAMKYNYERDDESFDVCDCDEENSSSSHVSC